MKMFSKVNFKFSLLVKKLQYHLDHYSQAVALHAWSIRSLPRFLFMLARLFLTRWERMTFNPCYTWYIDPLADRFLIVCYSELPEHNSSSEGQRSGVYLRHFEQRSAK